MKRIATFVALVGLALSGCGGSSDGGVLTAPPATNNASCASRLNARACDGVYSGAVNPDWDHPPHCVEDAIFFEVSGNVLVLDYLTGGCTGANSSGFLCSACGTVHGSVGIDTQTCEVHFTTAGEWCTKDFEFWATLDPSTCAVEGMYSFYCEGYCACQPTSNATFTATRR